MHDEERRREHAERAARVRAELEAEWAEHDARAATKAAGSKEPDGSVRLSFRVDEDMAKQLQARADAEYLPVSAVLRKLVRRGLADDAGGYAA